jgi:adenylylsulfate reductase subunit A
MIRQRKQEIKTDVLIIGGGLAGLNAAIAVAERGVDVLVVDKGGIARSGSIGGGVDHFMAYLNEGESWDTKEAYLRYCVEIARGAVDLEIQEAVFCNELDNAMKRIERLGVSLRNKEGIYYRTKAMGQPGPYLINFNGKQLKPSLAKEVRRLGVKALEKTMVTRLFTRNGVVCGVGGFNIRTGEFYVIHAKVIIGATGETNRLFQSPTHMPFNTWHCPYDTGDFQSMAFEVGAELTNMEYVWMNLVPKGFSAPGFGAFFSMGCTLINGYGEHYMDRIHKLATKAPRSMLVWATLKEIREGRGPIFIDARHLDSEKREHLFTTLGYDKDTLPDFLRAKGEAEFERGLIEVMVSEGLQCGPSEVSGAGIRINKNCASSVPGLYAAGDCSDQQASFHISTTGGYLAGKKAASYALEAGGLDVNPKEVQGEMKRVFAPMRQKTGVTHYEFEETLRKIMTDHLIPIRNEVSLNTALKKLKRMEPYKDQLKANNFHELMRVHEAQSLLNVGMLCCTASLVRKESRFIPYYYRNDYPEQNDKDYCGLILLKKRKNTEIETYFHPLEYNI